MLQLGDEHRRHAVDRCGVFRLDRSQRLTGVEALGREDHRRPLHQRTQGSQHAAEAVIQRDRQAEAVAVIEPLPQPGVVGIEQDVAMRERGPFGMSSGPRGVQDVDRRVGAERGFDLGQLLGEDFIRVGQQILPTEHPRWPFAAQGDERPQLRERAARQHPRSLGRQFGGRLIQNRHEVGRLEPIDQRQAPQIRLPQRIGQLAASVSRIDRDQHDANAGGRELQQLPLRDVGGPHAEVVTGSQSQRQQSAGDSIDLVIHFAPSLPLVEMAEDVGVIMRMPPRGFSQHGSDRESIDPRERRFVDRPMHRVRGRCQWRG